MPRLDTDTDRRHPGHGPSELGEGHESPRGLGPDDRFLTHHRRPRPHCDSAFDVDQLMSEGASSADPTQTRIKSYHPAVPVGSDGATMPGG